MRRRLAIPLLIAATLLAAAALLPGTPAGRGWLLERAVAVARTTGYELAFDRHRGNPWRGVELEGATLSGPGLDLSVGRADVAYFLPALLTGTLPLDLALADLGGAIEPATLAAPADGGGGGPQIRLRSLAVDGVALQLDGEALSLPALSLERLESAVDDDGRVTLDGVLVSDEGRVPFRGAATLAPFAFEATVEGAELAAARFWWEGVLGGHLDAEIRFADGVLNVDGSVRGAAIALAGATFDGLSGPVRLRDREIEANLDGFGLGGAVAADGTVDLAAERWQANYRATPTLAAGAAWLLPTLVDRTEALGLRADLAVQGWVGGWRDFATEGTVGGGGELLGRPFDATELTYAFDPAGLSVEGGIAWGGGSLRGSLATEGRDLTVDAAATGVAVTVAGVRLEGGATLDFRRSAGVDRAEVAADIAASFAGESAEFAIDGGLDADGWQAFVTGVEARGASVEGAAVLGPDGLSAGATFATLTLPGLPEPVDLALSANGPLDGLTVGIEVLAPSAIALDLGELAVEVDPRGALRGALTGRSVTLGGGLGPIALTLEGATDPLSVDIAYALAPTAFAVAALPGTQLQASVASGTVAWSEGAWAHRGELTLAPIVVGPLAVPELRGELVLGSSGPWLFTADDGSLTVAIEAGAVDLAAEQLPVGVSGVVATVAGSASFSLDDPATTFVGEVEAAALGQTIEARAKGAIVEVEGGLAAGFPLGTVTLDSPVALSGEVDLAAETIDAALSSEGIAVSLTGGFTSARPLVGAVATANSRAAATLDLGTLAWSVDGAFDLAALRLVGIAVEGGLAGSLSGRGATIEGALGGEVTAPIPSTVELSTVDGRVTLLGSASLAGVDVVVAGTVLPERELHADLGALGSVSLSGDGLEGSGTLPSVVLGPLGYAGEAWRLEGSIAEATATVRAGRSRAVGSWSDGWRVLATIVSDASLGTTPLAVEADVEIGSALPRGRVEGSMTALDGSARFVGSLDRIEVEADVPADTLAQTVGLTAVVPKGTLALAGTVAPLDGASFELSGVWRSDDFELAVAAEGSSGGVRAEAVGGGARLDVGSEGVEATLDAVALHRFLRDPPGEATATGTLRYGADGRWGGALDLSVVRPVAADLRLTGRGDALIAEAAWTSGALSAEAAGALLPTLDLAASLDLAGRGEVTLTARGTPTDPTVVGSVRIAEQSLLDLVDLPGLDAILRFDPTSATLHVAGEGVAGRVALDRIEGAVEVALRVAGLPHLVRIDIAGAPSDPAVSLTVDGPLAAGEADYDPDRGAVDVALALDPALLPTALPEGLELGTATVVGSYGSDRRWRGSAIAPTRYLGVEATAIADLEGRDLVYGGTVTLRSDGAGADAAPLALARIEGDATAARLDVDLATVDVAALASAFGLPVTGNADGSAVLTTAPATLQIDGGLSGTAQGVDVDLRGSFDGAHLDLDLTAAGVAVGAEGTLAQLTLAVTDDPTGGAFDLTGELTLSGDPGLALSGTAFGQSATLEAALSAGRVALTAEVGTTRLEARTLGALAELVVDAALATEDLAGLGPVTAQVAVARSGGGWTTEIEAELPDAPAVRRLSLAGSVLPEADLSGEAELLEPFGPVSLTVGTLGGPLGDAVVTVRRSELALRAELTEGVRLTTVSLHGAGEIALAGTDWNLDAGDLRWSPDGGFAGAATVGGRLFDTAVEAELNGRGGIEADVVAARPGLDLSARIEAGARPWSDVEIVGALDFVADAALLPETQLPRGASLDGDAEIAGSWREPQLSGQLALLGPVEASGRWSYAEGGADLSLIGERFELNLLGDRSGWRGDGAVAGWPLGPQLPWVAEPTLSLRGSGNGDWSGSLAATVEELALTAPGSSALGRGSLRISEGVTTYTAVTRLDLDLADLTIGPPLRGRVRGPVALTGADGAPESAALSGLLTLAGGGAAERDDASLNGTLQVSGDLADPSIRLALDGVGSASGGLRGEVLPRRPHVTMVSDLDFEGVESDLSFTYDGAAFDAEGTLAYRDLRLRVQGVPGGLALRGEAGLDGVSGVVDPTTLEAHLEAELDGLVPNARGRVSLALAGLGSAGRWLTGEVVGAEMVGVPLGDLSFEAATPGGAIVVAGEGIVGTVAPLEGATWTASITARRLGPELELSLDAAGRGASGSGSGRLVGGLADGDLDLEFAAAFDAAPSLRVEGAALGGQLALEAEFDGAGWVGAVGLDGATVAGQRLDLDGTVLGPLTDPQLALRVRSAGAAAVSADATLSRSGVEVAGSADVPGLTTPLRFQGPLWPSPALTLALSAGDGLRVSAPSLSTDALLGFAGSLSLDLGPVALALAGDGRSLRASARSRRIGALPALEVGSEPLTGSATSLWEHLERRGLALTGGGGLVGSLTLFPTTQAVALDGIQVEDGGLTLTLDGRVGLRGDTALRGRLAVDGGALPFTTAERLDLPFDLLGDVERWQLVVAGERGRLEVDVRRDTLASTVLGRLDIGGGSIEADLALNGSEAAGQVALDGVRLSGVPGLAGFTLSGRIDALGDRLGGRFDLDDLAGRGGLDLTVGYPVAGLLGGLPPLDPLEADARLRTFAVGSFPVVASTAPNLVGEVSGVAQLRNGRVVGRLVAPGLAVFDTPLPTDVEFNGDASELELRGNVAGSALSATLTPAAAQALLRFERFPMQTVTEAVAGRSDISAELTGVARLSLPFADPASADLRVATEQIRLERDGVVTVGNATFDYLGGSLTVERVAFEGAGSWQASGVVRNDLLDFRASAQDADFGPLLGIIPALARLDTGARGSLDLVATGSLRRPTIDVGSEALEVTVAGSSYRLEEALATLRGPTLTLDAAVVGVAPIVGRLLISGGGTLTLAPVRLEAASFDLAGAATVPILGEVTDLTGTVAARDGAPYLLATGRVGNPFTLEGSLLPLDLRLRGDDLAISAPSLLLASSVMDADVRLRSDDGIDIGGALTASEARFQLGIRPQSSGDGGGGGRALERVRFDDLTIEAPGRIFFNESFAALEARAQLTLGGTAAGPRLAGTASALRGSIRFSGRDFAIERGVATFEPTRGAYPLIDLVAVTSFEKSRVIPGGSGVRFVEPRGTAGFDVRLGFQGALDARPGGGFDLDFDPDLSSDALIEVEGEAALASGPRPLTPSELLALVTLGRLDISSILAGDGGLVTAVAQGALDTAVDLLVLAELQNALSEALGVEVVEIRTTALSSLLDGDGDDPFGVSLRLGGYLSEELFASFQIGSFDDEESEFALTNEVRLTYDLGPVTFDLAGGVNVPADGTQQPIPKLSSSVSYSFNTLLGLEAGVDLSSERSQLRVGLTLRW